MDKFGVQGSRQNSKLMSRQMITCWGIVFIGVVFVVTIFVNRAHIHNQGLAEQLAKDCKETGGIPEMQNHWTGIGVKVTCKLN